MTVDQVASPWVSLGDLRHGAMRITGDGIWGEPPDRNAAKAVLR
jgi:pyridoxine 4-dehydrogenase